MDRLVLLIKYIIIAIIQGISEILPISSSGHLAIFYYLLEIDISSQLNLTVFLHLASSIALCVYFKDTIITLIKDFFLFIFKKNIKYKNGFLTSIYLIVATIPSILVGFLIKPLIENYFDNLWFVAVNFLITALLLFILPKIKNNNLNYSLKNTFTVGVFQSFALLPGISRSATTLFAAKLAKIEISLAKRFVFLLLLPISFGSTILSIIDITNSNFNISNITLYFISMIITFIFTLLSLKFIFNKVNFNKR